MKRNFFLVLSICLFMTFFSSAIFALNPFITQLFNADPSAHAFEGRMYVYPSHDKDNATFFDMEDYHVYSSADMINWVDHGIVLTYKDPDWVMKTDIDYPVIDDPDCRHPRLWAPDCAFKNNTYYFYYPARDEANRFRIGVATSKSPSGPFIPVKYNGVETCIPGSFSMDPCVFIDDDGRAYMFIGGLANGQLPWPDEGLLGCAYWAELNTDNPNDPETYMVTFKNPPVPVQGYLDSDETVIGNVGSDAPFTWYEASWVHKRNNKYYLSYSIGDLLGTQSRIHYAMSDNIAGPWTYKGEIIGDVIGWTNHHSFAEFNGDWYAFYHNSVLSDGIIGKRSICVDRISYNAATGEISHMNQTTAGTGTSAYSRIKAMLYSGQYGINLEECAGGDIGKCVTGMDIDDYIYFDNVDFGTNGADRFEAMVSSSEGCTGGTIEIRIDSLTGNMYQGISSVPQGLNKWTYISCPILPNFNGRHKVYLVFKGYQGSSSNLFKLNWFTFKHSKSAPLGYQAAFKSLNPNCRDYSNSNNKGQMYLCVDDNYNQDLCANRPAAAGGWEKFSLIISPLISGDYLENNTVKIRSSNNGKLLVRGGNLIPIKARDRINREPLYIDSFYWEANEDGTISLKNKYSNKYVCVDTWNGKPDNPAKAYDNRDQIDYAEKFYCEAGDAPIGYVVAFKSQNPDCYDDKRNKGQKYLCADTNINGDLCANRAAVGGTWEKFLVVDANNGYVALKSLNTNQFIRYYNKGYPGSAYGGTSLDTQDNFMRFQWKNNGDGTVSLFNVGLKQYLCVDTDSNTGKGNNPGKCYANRSDVGQNSNGISWEKFYCQITQ